MAGASPSVPWCSKWASVARRCDSSKWVKLTLGSVPYPERSCMVSQQ